MIQIQIASRAGFCMGVRRAINLTLSESKKHRGNLYTLGSLIHNPQIIDLLEKRGIRAVTHTDNLTPGRIVIRAHGVPPQVAQEIGKKGLDILDATCPHVARIHKIIRKHADQGYDIVIMGDKGHAEVDGLEGSARGKAHVVSDSSELTNLPQLKTPVVVAQTTQSVTKFKELAKKIKQKHPDAMIYDTICRSTEQRQEEIINLSKQFDLTIVVGGRNSANTQRLAEVVRDNGRAVITVQDEGELTPEILKRKKRILVAAGASTPNWMIHRVVQHVRKHDNLNRPWPIRWLMRFTDALSGAYFDLGFVAVLLASAVWSMTGEPIPHTPYLGIIFSYIIGMYTLNHLTNIEANQLQEIFKRDPVNRFRRLYIVMAVVALITAVGLAFTINLVSVLFVAFVEMAGILYNLPIIPRKLALRTGGLRIKDVPLSKDLGISFGWTSIIVLLPFINRPLDPVYVTKGVLIGLLVAGTSFLHALVNDLQDVQKDMFLGRETIPIVLGKRKVWLVANTINSFLVMLIVVGIGSSMLHAGSWFMVVLPVLISYLLYLHYRDQLSRITNLRRIMDIIIASVSSGVVLLVAWIAG